MFVPNISQNENGVGTICPEERREKGVLKIHKGGIKKRDVFFGWAKQNRLDPQIEAPTARVEKRTEKSRFPVYAGYPE